MFIKPDQLILLVEDSPEDYQATVRSLRRAGLANPISHCEDGDQALDYVFRRGAFSPPVRCCKRGSRYRRGTWPPASRQWSRSRSTGPHATGSESARSIIATGRSHTGRTCDQSAVDPRGARARQYDQRRHQRTQFAHDHGHHHRPDILLRSDA